MENNDKYLIVETRNRRFFISKHPEILIIDYEMQNQTIQISLLDYVKISCFGLN